MGTISQALGLQWGFVICSLLGGIVLLVTVLVTQKPKKDTLQLENEIDQLVYKLYNLTPEKIKIIEDSIM